MFKRDPAPVVPILEQLKADPSLYVRKSALLNTDWIIRQGCRTLIRKADSEVLELFGYAETGDLVTSASLLVLPSKLAIGKSCELEYELCIREGDPVHIRVEYGIEFG